MRDGATPNYPKLRPLDIRPIQHEGMQYFLLRDPLGLTEQVLLIPAPLAPLLVLCDGTRDASALHSALELRTGIPLTPVQVQQFLGQLDEALLLDNARFHDARVRTLEEYRRAPYRHPALAGTTYPADPDDLLRTLQDYCEAARGRSGNARARASGDIVALLSPHIDYQRGGPVYAGVWEQAAEGLREAEVVVVLGTDHAGGPGHLTLTRQHYVSPLGRLPTDTAAVDALAQAVGPEAVFADELHHVKEHSIELAAVWLQYALQGREVPIVPVLCGSMEHFVAGMGEPEEDEVLERFLGTLRGVLADRRGVVVVAGDLAHVGPAFGDPEPLDAPARERLARADQDTLSVIGAADARRFLDNVRQNRDARRYCGLMPIYLALRLMDGAAGELTGYDLCPADDQAGSLVTVAGMVFREST